MNTFVLSDKPIVNLGDFHKKIKSQVPEFIGFNIENNIITVELSVESTPYLIEKIENISPPTNTTQHRCELVVVEAMKFGQQLMTQFAAENIILGIIEAGMTKIVRQNLSEVVGALITGSLYDAINELKNIPENKKDTVFITNERLLIFVNKIEKYLNLPLSENLL